MDELSLDLKIRKTESGWEATVISGQGLAICSLAGTPQRAMLRLALAMIAKPNEAPCLERFFAVEDPLVRRLIGEAETAARKAERQMSAGIGSVEQCQRTEAPTE